MTHSVLILGGTTEARALASRLAAEPDLACVLSLAGRTKSPLTQAVATRIGGFGGVDGLAAHLSTERVELLIDATHPYAARISANAAAAAAKAGVALVSLRRPAWERVDGDRWTEVDTVAQAIAALGAMPRRVFVALGRNELAPVETAPQHAYVVRSVDPVEPPLAVPDCAYITERGPFDEAAEEALLRERAIDAIVSKNSGGRATHGKIAAARRLGLEVVMIRRPPLPETPSAATVEGLVRLVRHALASPVAAGQERGE